MIMCVLLCYPVSIHMSQLLSTGRPISSCDIFIDSYSPVKKFYSFITFSSLNCLVLILNLYMQCSESIPICVLFHYFYISWC